MPYLVIFLLISLSVNSQGADYIGASECAGCHQQEFDDWQGSHHDWAMKVASPETVLGDFNNAIFAHGGVVSTFTRKQGQYYVNTQGADGKYRDFKVDYSFGVEPLQQYLISFPDGRIQALTTAWDSRPKQQGGQRWYQLMPNDKGEPGESLHWTGAYYNWNSHCADCHSTGLQKNYSPSTDTYATIWSEINVACESCHGPGSDHREWAQSANRPASANGLQVQYGKPVDWIIANGASIASAQGDPHQAAIPETQSCAGCHSRRSKVSNDPINNHIEGHTFLDHYSLQTLQQGVYHADGQIQGEVYVYGSFIQSKMYQRGVTCSNCHNPHSLEPVAEGNELCAGCHAPETYNQPSHHFHKGDNSAGAQCVNCHMPATVYMGVDSRRDHSMRIPRPDITGPIGAPNACNSCHTDKTAAWSASAIQSWLHDSTRPPELVATALSAARYSQPNADQLLIELANNPSIASVRFEATRLLLGLAGLNNYQQRELDSNIALYMESLRVSADMPGGQLNLASAYIAQGQYQEAEKAYIQALKLDSNSLPALLNLADLYRAQGREQLAIERLLQARSGYPYSPEAHHGLGLAQIRSQQPLEALASLQRAMQLAPDNDRYVYIYALALNSQGRGAEAIDILDGALKPAQPNRDMLLALVTISRDMGRSKQARDFADKLVIAFPQDNAAARLRDSLQ